MESSSDSEAEREAVKQDLKNAKINHSDLTKDMEVKAIRYAVEAISKSTLDKDAGSYLKQKLDTDPDFQGGGDGAWQVVIGRSFAASLTYATHYLMFFELLSKRRSVLIFKTQ
ncbi:unnamed protein product [Blepharisma stoltei]|uniref:Dynein light chain n=1 Tax=Blepharisma stoltei TaxID=1481888 RepID=A0AAU9INC5_9CILI|nr:unnamed protein product [Blepharisma stoltei]